MRHISALLPEIIQPAWDAYLVMSETKHAYYSFLRSLNQKYQDQDQCDASLQERQTLEDLLESHSDAVLKFTQEMRLIDNLEARQLLLDKMR